MSQFDDAYYADLVERRYFGNVAAGEIAAAVDCFTLDARVTIYHGDNPVRRFARPESADYGAPLPTFFEHLCGNFTPRFEGFTHYIDIPHQRIASTFTVTLEPMTESPYFNAGTQTLNNCNFFLCSGGLVREMTIYYANPSAQASAGRTPTGYPPD